ncbi:oxygen-dependent protoporphyrinogen oxidase [Tessaracoccus bendigoensis DSM 12906]|uniref:Oxygen-dependent protoporphyrinogen oxidase n=1 Tax=Tessaracoccus bendigoensis DSM 12906 TaxID=1123357 RepID=A0A1M6MZ90_9ACTN|nr:FAD-dependent oxidoreductase [Tessaracoccus bendigoensis]SHJ88702.1 oxygen-dependent protoporphyrinogen oxidase [Tessaracoccus bendigoensis DSM 12906]
MNAVVVGGGLAGLLTAYRLMQAGHSVKIREAAPHWGGMIAPVQVAGIQVDSGAEAYSTRGGLGRALCRELGLEVAAPESHPHVWWADGSWPMAEGLLGIPGSLDDPSLGVLSDEEKARFAKDLELGPEVGQDAHTIGDLARVRLGAGAVAKLVAPVATSIYATTPEHLSLAAVAPGILESIRTEGSLIGAVAALSASRGSAVEQPHGGMFRLIDALAARLEEAGVDVRLAAPVASLRRSRQGLHVHVRDGEDLLTERVVLATPAAVTVRLMGGLGVEFPAPPVHKARQVLLAASSAGLKDHPVGSGVLVATRDAVRAKALTHYSAKWPWAAQSGLEVLRLSYPDHVFPTRAEVLADASRLTGVRIADSEAVGLVSVSWDSLPTRIEAANRDHLVGMAAAVGVDMVGAWLDGNGISTVIAGTQRVHA